MIPHHLAAGLLRRPYRAWVAACALLVCAGLILITSALNTGPHAPRPDHNDALASLGPVGSSSTHAATTPLGQRATTPSGAPSIPAAPGGLARSGQQRSLPASNPTSLVVPAIGISSSITQLGLKADGSIEVPPLSRHSPAGWYRLSPTPGEQGTSIMLGHIDSAAYGPAVFFRLGALHPGDEIDVHRADGITAVFRIDRVAQYPKKAFPSQLVYGTTPYPSLRLITCGGHFDRAAHSYQDNVVVYATLTAGHH